MNLIAKNSSSFGENLLIYIRYEIYENFYRAANNFSRLRLKFISLSVPPRGRLSRNKGQLKVNLNLEDPKLKMMN